MKIVAAYTGIDHAPGCECGRDIVIALQNLGHTVSDYGVYYRSRVPIPGSIGLSEIEKNDLLVVVDSGTMDETYTALASLKIPKVFWIFDICCNPQRYYDYLS